MLDGVGCACRARLDEDGFDPVAIMAYSAKYASGYYGPFREAVDSAPQHGDRRGYQMDPANVAEAVREVSMDVAEGADFWRGAPAVVAGWATGGLFLSLGANIVSRELGGTAHVWQG